MKDSRHFSFSWLYPFSLFLVVFLIFSSFGFAEEKSSPVAPQSKEGYTINFENVSIQEFLRFVSKISGTNVIYNEEDLNFNVTIYSEEETSLDNIMSALVQILRIHDLLLLEEEQNLLIHKNPNVKQIPTVVSEETHTDGKDLPPIVTKVFKIYKGNPSHIAALLTPMLSSTAIVEVSMQTRQLIITDTLSSIETIQQLLLSLDAPETPYDLDVYPAKYIAASELSQIAGKIMRPISDNTLLEIIAQDQTQSIYIVSTPFLLDKTLAVLRELDREPLASLKGNIKSFSHENVFVYRLKDKSVEDIKTSLQNILKEAEQQGFRSNSLSATVDSMKYVPTTNSVMFIGPPDDLKIIQSFLESLDFGKASGGGFYIYEPTGLSLDNTLKILKEIEAHFRSTGYGNPALLSAIKSAKPIEAIQSILFTGTQETLAELKGLLASIENAYSLEIERQGPTKFLVYNIQAANEEQIREALHNLADYLENNDLPNTNLIDAIDSMKWIRSSNSLLFTGHSKALGELQQLLPTFDVSPQSSKTALHQTPPSTDFFVFTPKEASAEEMKKMILETAENLKSANLADPAFLQTLESARILPSSNQIVFTGDQISLARLHTLLQDLDQSENLEDGRAQSFPIALKYVNYETVKNALDHYAEELPNDDPVKKMIRSMQWVPQSRLLLFHGSAQAMKKINRVIALTDTQENASTDYSNFSLIRVKQGDGREILDQLRSTAKQLKRSNTASDSLITALESAEWVPGSNNILVVGSNKDITRVRELIENYDVQEGVNAKNEVFVYKLKYISFKELQTALRGIADHAGTHDQSATIDRLSRAIESMREIPDSNAVQFVGSPATIEKIKNLLLILDTPENASGVKQGLGSNFLVYRVKNLPPEELISHLKSIATDALTAKQAKDSSLIRSINTVRYVKGSNALIFTGNKADLDKIQSLLERLDQREGPKQPQTGRKAESYQLYTPVYIPGPELIQMARNFLDHLVSSGVSEPELAEVIDNLSYVNRTNTVILTGPPSAITQVLELFKRFDTENAATKDTSIEAIDNTGFLLYKVQNISGESLVDAMQKIGSDIDRAPSAQKKNEAFIDAIRSVQWIDATNSLLATGDNSVLKSVKQLMESLDRPLKQVFIEILVIETTISDELDFGLSWQSQGTVHDRFAWGTGNYTSDPNNPAIPFASNMTKISGTRTPQGQDIPPMQGGFLGIIGDLLFHKGKTYASLGSLLNALKSDGTATVVLSQKVVAQDNQNAKIFTGENIPFTGSLVTTSGLSQTTNANLEYRNIGVTLNLTPIIGDNDVITLSIDEEISEEVNSGDTGSSVSLTTINGIRTSKTSMQTKVHIPDQSFLILSGTMRNNVTRSVSGIPCLGGLPLIGAAFSETKKLTNSRNVIIFVKPHIIKNEEIYGRISQHQENLYESLGNAEDFDQGLEFVKTPDDREFDDLDHEDYP